MARAPTSSEVAVAGTKPVAATRSFTWKFWVKVASIIVVITSPWIPCLWGWQMGWLGTGHGSWSMAAHNGIMPGSIVYKKALSEYSAGDKISFEYKESADPTQNGPSLKLVVANNGDGTYHVKGMNDLNSIPPCNVKREDIDGKVVWSQSFMPESYWRWLSMDWTLTADQIEARKKAIFSRRTAGGVFTKEGRFRNWIIGNFPPDAKRRDGDYLVFEYDGCVEVVWRGQKKVLAHENGQFVDWNNDVLIYRTGKSLRSFDPKTGQKTIRKDSLYPAKTGEQVELTVRNDGQTFFGPTYVLIGKSLPKEAKIRIKGVTYSLRTYREFDYDPILKKSASSFNLTPRDDSVPSGTITATVVSG